MLSLLVAGSAAAAPLSFERNIGQAGPDVKFLSRLEGCEVAFSSTEVVLRFPSRVVHMRLDAARRSPVVTGFREQPGKVHYLTGNNSKRWRTNIPIYANVRYEGVYPGVDLSLYGTRQQLEYDFIVAARAEPKEIRLRFDGVAPPRVDAEGDLILEGGDAIRLRKPVLYLDVNGVRKEISGGYSVHGKRVGFWTEPYDSTKPLVIDPVLVYETRPGQGWINGMAVDAAGNTYLAGSVWPQPTVFSPTEVLTRLDANGTPLYTTTSMARLTAAWAISRWQASL